MSDYDEAQTEGDDVRVKVTDRRKFNAEGNLKGESSAGSEEAEPAPGPAPETPPSPAPDGPDASPEESPRREAPASQGSPGQVDFQSFVYFLYMSALHELGIPTQPQEEPRPADLERARFFVEVLQILEGKTKGNLEPGEAKLLEEALYNLRMQYVGAAKAADS